MRNLPSFQSYGRYSSDNYGSYCLQFFVGDITIYFSYQTPIAFRAPGRGLVVRQNDWGPTTGKHLNWIDGGNKADRINGEKFEKLLAEVTANKGEK